MDKSWLNRSEMLLGKDILHKLEQTRVCIIGLGGVGSYAAEALARAGIGKFVLIDFDVVSITNLNRQIIALTSTIGKDKTIVMKERILTINPLAELRCHNEFLNQDNRALLLDGSDYYIDAIDSIGPKVGLLEEALKNKLKIITIMGAGNRLDPSQIKIGSLEKSHNCPLAKRVRKFLRRRGLKPDIPAVYSIEPPILSIQNESENLDEIIHESENQKQIIGSISYMPAIMGMMAASWVVNQVGKQER